MKKFVIFIIIILTIIVSIFGFFLYSLDNPKQTNTLDKALTLQEEIQKNSSWLELTKEDFYGYLNGTYTEAVQTILTSLEEASPIIIQTSNDKFGDFEDYTFIVASAFNTSNQVYIYYYNSSTNSYLKTTASISNLLEDAHAVYVYNETEGLE